MNAEVTIATSPYLLAEPPTSPGRALLARAYEHFCALQWGYTGEEIAAAFSGGGERRIADDLGWSTRLLGELLARGEIRSWGRPIGGGEPVALKSSVWELDDFRHRFAHSAMCLATPFDVGGVPSHWIFVALDDWNRVVEASLGMASADAVDPKVRPSTPKSVAQPPLRGSAPGGEKASMPADSDRLIRLPEVMARTSLSKPTIYRRMATGGFPRNLLLPGNISVWRETEISDWIADPLGPVAG